MSHPTSYCSGTTHVAPYLTHVVAHHGQLTLIPPDNAGRMRKARTKKHRTKEDGRRADESDVSVVLTGASATLSHHAEPEPAPRPSNRTVEERRQIRHLYDSMAIPDCPPPSFQEAISTAPTFQPFALSGNGSSTALSSPYMTMPSTYSLATTLSPMHHLGSHARCATPPSSPYPSQDEVEIEVEDYDSGSEGSSIESLDELTPSQTRWDEDRLMGMTLDERVHRERERRLAFEGASLSPLMHSPPSSPLRSPMSFTSERQYAQGDPAEYPRARQARRARTSHGRPSSPAMDEATETRRFASSSVANLLHRRLRSEPQTSRERPASPSDEAADTRRLASSSVSNLLSRRLLSKSKKGPSPLKVSSGPRDSPLSSPSSFSLSVFIPSRPTSPTANDNDIHGSSGHAQSPTLASKTFSFSRKRRGSIPSLQVFSSLKGKQRDHGSSGNSSNEKLESWQIVADDEIPDSPSLELDLCAEFPSPPDTIPVPGQLPRAQSPTSPILPSSPTNSGGFAKLKRAFASASTLNLNLMSRQDLASRPFTGQPTSTDDDMPTSPYMRDQHAALSLDPREPQLRRPQVPPLSEKFRSPPASPVSPQYTHPLCPGSPVSPQYAQFPRPGSPVSPVYSRRPASPTSPQHAHFSRPSSPVSPVITTAGPSKRAKRPPPPPPPRRGAHKQSGESPLPKPISSGTPNNSTSTSADSSESTPVVGLSPNPVNPRTRDNSASVSGTSSQMEQIRTESASVTEAVESFIRKPIYTGDGTAPFIGRSLTKPVSPEQHSPAKPGISSNKNTDVSQSSNPFCSGTPPGPCGCDRGDLPPIPAVSGVVMQPGSRYIDAPPRRPANPTDLPERATSPPRRQHYPSHPVSSPPTISPDQVMSSRSSRHHYPGRPLPVPPSVRSPIDGSFPISVREDGPWREKCLSSLDTPQAVPGNASDPFSIPPPSYAASYGRQAPIASSSNRHDSPLSPIHTSAVTAHHAIAFPTSPPVADPYTQRTELDDFLSRIENRGSDDGDNYEDLLLLSELVGPARPGQANAQGIKNLDEKENMPLLGRIEVERRRVTKDGRLKVKLSLAGVSVDKCGICLSQFKEDQWAALGAECQHAFHEKCLRPWLARKQTCPMCRSSLTLEGP